MDGSLLKFRPSDAFSFDRIYQAVCWVVIMALAVGCGSGGKGDTFQCQGLGGNTVSGTVLYEKKVAGLNGTRTEYWPVRFAEVEVRGPGVFVTTKTDANGRYCAIYVKSGGPAENTLTVTAKTDAPGLDVQVGFFYGVQSPTDPNETEFRFAKHTYFTKFKEIQDQSTYGLDIVMRFQTLPTNCDRISKSINDCNPGGVFNIMDTLSRGVEFVGRIREDVSVPLVTGVWQEEITGTFFISEDQCSSIDPSLASSCIFIRGDGVIIFGEEFGDRDEIDDDIILHEYGHFISDHFSRDNSRGGTHFLGDFSQDVRLAWSEGWATFFSSAIRDNPVNMDVGLDGVPFFAFSIDSNQLLSEGNLSLEKNAIYTTSEVAVASVLWDIYDNLANPQETFDSLSLGFGPIWDILNFWKNEPTPPIISMEAFWDSFGTVQPAFINIVAERGMEISEDSFEPDALPSEAHLANPDTTEHHTLYPEGDLDYIAFQAVSGKSYKFETLNLKNGVDTYLAIVEILNGSENVLVTNDNSDNRIYKDGCNTWVDTVCLATDSQGNCTDARYITLEQPACPNAVPLFPVRDTEKQNPFPSMIQFTPLSDGTYYARIMRSKNTPPSTGRYGSYDFRVTASP
jgi:hypothetical protein